MKRYITGILLALVLGGQSLFGFGSGFGGGFGGFPGLGGSFPGFNPGGTGSSGEQQEKTTEFAVLAGYSGVTHSDVGKIAFAPSIQLRLAAKRFQFMVDGTYVEDNDSSSSPGIFLMYGGLGYQLIKSKAFDFSASVVAGYSSIWRNNIPSDSYYGYDSYYGSYYTRDTSTDSKSWNGFLVGADLLAMLKLGKHLGIYANGLLSTGGMGAKLGVAYRF